MIDTGKVQGRRVLRFESLNDMVDEARRLADADRAGKLQHLGNWMLGQTFAHVAYWIHTPFDGYPPTLNPPFFVKWIFKFRKRAMLNDPMPAGVKIPKVEGGTLGMEPVSCDEGLARIVKGAERLKEGAPPRPNIILGPLTHEEWIKLNLRHAELHFSFHRA